MKAEELLELIGEAPDGEIEGARQGRKGTPRWVKWGALAACAVAVVGLGTLGALVLRNLGGASAGGSGGADLTYMSYTGPVFPLTVRGDAQGVAAQRAVELDFAPYTPVTEEWTDEATGEKHTYEVCDHEVAVSDRYTLTNPTDKAVALTLLYPYAGALSREEQYRPALTVDGAAVQTDRQAGPYAGGFMGAWGGDDMENGSVNLRHFDRFECYQALLGDSTAYQDSAFDPFPDLDAVPVTVYRLHDYRYTADESAPNPSLRFSFTADPEKTRVLTYGFNGSSDDWDRGEFIRVVSGIEIRPQASPEMAYPQDAYVILVGEDLESYTLRGYKTGGFDSGDTLDDLGCSVSRDTSTLGEMLRQFIREWDDVDTELLYNLAAELMMDYGPLSSAGKERYSNGMLEDILSEAHNDNRVFYETFSVTIPAGGSVTVEASYRQEASMDFVGRDKNRDGYDLATTLGSNLIFTGETAAVRNTQYVEIVAQNFGFDVENGVTQVELDLTEPQYWLQVVRREN